MKGWDAACVRTLGQHSQAPHQKINKYTFGWECNSVVEYFPSFGEVQSPALPKKEKSEQFSSI